MSRVRDAKEKWLFVMAAALVVVFACGSAHANPPHQRSFSSPGAAVRAMADAVKADDTRALLRIFGPGSKDIVLSGDPVEDKEGHLRFIKRYEEKNRLEEVSGKVILYTGNDEWPFPIPIVKAGTRWRFDAKAGGQEILARRVGRNELNAIQVCLAYVDAQQEYAMKKGRQGNGLLEYAQKFVSTPGAHDGLYWEAKEGEEQSPMGPLFATAREAGYSGELLGGESAPYHGYFYRILKAQGKDAPGGRPGLSGWRQNDRRVRHRRVPGEIRRFRRHDLHREPGRSRLPEGPGQGRETRCSRHERIRSRQNLGQGASIGAIGLNCQLAQRRCARPSQPLY